MNWSNHLIIPSLDEEENVFLVRIPETKKKVKVLL